MRSRHPADQLALTTGHQHDLSGPSPQEAAARLADFHHRTGFAGSVVTDPTPVPG
ncbi:hypothetical protein [Streptomyces sp. JH34]|uniref:hypothetical protein n=1 Tax=Streptomyces sp. JH34 TaxID=2793633 RepID=UPI0023F93E5F|nr:hypothetical protein [Streptomyces sp. JH34]MDF6017018.1 hypothetical protein [Streptomyces sp. JH34]